MTKSLSTDTGEDLSGQKTRFSYVFLTIRYPGMVAYSLGVSSL